MDITLEMIEALRTLRTASIHENPTDLYNAIEVLDNADIFNPIDDVTGYDIDPDPYLPLGDPAEMGDLVAEVSIVGSDGGQTVHCTQHGDVGAVYGPNPPLFTEGWRDEHIRKHQAAQSPAAADRAAVVATYPAGPDGETGYTYSDGTHDEGQKAGRDPVVEAEA